MIEIRAGVINGDLIKDILDICNEWFINSMIQPYAGANRECLFCGCGEDRNGGTNHSVADCPVMKYKDIYEKHSEFLNLKE